MPTSLPTPIPAMDAWTHTKRRTCPRSFAGLRCVAHRHEDPCVCQRHERILDHLNVWRDTDGRPVLTAEPYNTTGEAVAALTADLARFGLAVSLSGCSQHYPGATFTIHITREETV